MITIQELLFNRGLDKKSKIKLVRHKDKRVDLYNLYRTDKGKFFEYQRCQNKNVFKGADLIVSFIGEEGTLARFIGIFKILECKELREKKIGFWGGTYNYYYQFEEIFGYDDLKERVIINWGTATLSWYQWLNNSKEVIQIHPGLHYTQFTDYFDFILSFQQLKEIVTNQYGDWKNMLSATKGIYLINDTKTGRLYVGSAYGDDGIWGRWTSYVKTNGHGNNKTLKEFIALDSNYACNFCFSILMLLPKTVTSKQAIEKEELFKKKLGTRSFGLNN